MALDREIEAMRRKLLQIAPVVDPPTLKMNVYTQEEWDNKNPLARANGKLI